MSPDTALTMALSGLNAKPPDDADQRKKKRYSELLSEAVAQAIAAALRERGLTETRPAPPGVLDNSGAERRMSGGIGDKKVDVTWATEQAGLLLGVSVKSINFRDRRTHNFQKNFTNRRGDMLFEAVTLHRRFPYAVLIGLFFFDKDAESDDTERRRSTFVNAHAGLRLFTGREDPAGRDEQFERFYVVLVDATPFGSTARFYLAGEPDREVPFEEILDDAVEILADRNPDSYEANEGQLRRV